jgi:DNA-binding transcriptional ArsR family regulator
MKDQDDKIVRIAKALADKTRVKILRELVKRGPLNCSAVEDVTSLSQPAVSHHLKVLADAKLVVMQKEGRQVIVILNRKAIEKFASLLP